MVPKQLEECCNEHDKCYDTCGRSKESCDAAFGNCLDKICKFEYSLIDLACKTVLPAIVIVAACTEYLDAQESACNCK